MSEWRSGVPGMFGIASSEGVTRRAMRRANLAYLPGPVWRKSGAPSSRRISLCGLRKRPLSPRLERAHAPLSYRRRPASAPAEVACWRTRSTTSADAAASLWRGEPNDPLPHSPRLLRADCGCSRARSLRPADHESAQAGCCGKAAAIIPGRHLVSASSDVIQNSAQVLEPVGRRLQTVGVVVSFTPEVHHGPDQLAFRRRCRGVRHAACAGPLLGPRSGRRGSRRLLSDKPAGAGERAGDPHWHVYQYARAADAEAEAKRHLWAAVAHAHGRFWLYVLGGPSEPITGGEKRAVIGPLTTPSESMLTAHFSEAIFPPGMRTRVHSHPGPEAFYVVEGEQCMDTPTDRRKIAAGGIYVVPGGPHLQAAPHGRRNLVLILAPRGQPFVIPGGDWKPSDFCDH